MSAPSNVHPLEDRFRGALLGTLMGDALGMPWEGWTAERIREEVAQPREMIEARRGAGTFTDDTQMTAAPVVSAIPPAPRPASGARLEPAVPYSFGHRFES
jgi:hypothetical protein